VTPFCLVFALTWWYRNAPPIPIKAIKLDANYGDSEKVILKAFDLGIFSFDNAYNYGPSAGAAERMFGEVYRANLKPYRDEL